MGQKNQDEADYQHENHGNEPPHFPLNKKLKESMDRGKFNFDRLCNCLKKCHGPSPGLRIERLSNSTLKRLSPFCVAEGKEEMLQRSTLKVERRLLEILVCPRDQTLLELRGSSLKCARGHVYPVLDGIPILLLEEAKPIHGGFSETFGAVNQEIHDSRDGDRGAHGIDAHVQQDIVGTGGSMYKPLVGKLTRYPIPNLRLPKGNGRRFLDLGCNWGRWCLSAAQEGYSPVGIDPWLDSVRAARRVAHQLGSPASYLVADARHLPFAKGSFDVVFSYSVLQHFDDSDVDCALAEISRVVRRPGTTLIQMANAFGLWNFARQLVRGFRNPEEFQDVRYRTPSELTVLFGRHFENPELCVDSYFGLNAQVSDLDLLSTRYRWVVQGSEIMRKLSKKFAVLKYCADSLYVESNL